VSRRRFLGAGLAAAAGLLLPAPSFAALRARGYRDLRRHFVFEYYPWYAADPFRHWDGDDRVPPVDLSSPYMPLLGAYDSRSRAVLAQHARWIAESGVGAINLSWWGPDSFEDRAVHTVMDVMRDHDIKVAFHMEPYAPDRGRRFADDVLYLIENYGERRGFDAFLLLQDADGGIGPVFKGFRTVLSPTFRTCRGETRPVADYTSDEEWRAQLARLRATLRGTFGRIRFLADTSDVGRTVASTFDGIAIYDSVGAPPERYAEYARTASARGLLFSLNVNSGYYDVEPRQPRVNECGEVQPRIPFTPGSPQLDLSTPGGRELAAALSRQRIWSSFKGTVALQTDPALTNAQRGFFLVYINSFNEWHEGTQFEPMKDAEDLTPAERAIGYANPARGDYRLALLKDLLERAFP
jgi:hypothetical protein